MNSNTDDCSSRSTLSLSVSAHEAAAAPVCEEEPPIVNKARSLDDFYTQAYESSNGLRLRIRYYMCFMALAVANVGNMGGSSAVGFLLAYELFQEQASQGRDGLVAISYYVGALVGGLFGGTLSDVFGRRCILLLSISCTATFGTFTAFTTGKKVCIAAST
jgi:hypothetical protein